MFQISFRGYALYIQKAIVNDSHGLAKFLQILTREQTARMTYYNSTRESYKASFYYTSGIDCAFDENQGKHSRNLVSSYVFLDFIDAKVSEVTRIQIVES